MGFLQRLSEDRGTWSGPFSLNPSSGKYKDPVLNRLFGSNPVHAGIHVDERNAFTFSAVYDAVNQIASDVAKLPLNLRRCLKEGGSELYTRPKLYNLLKRRPNPEMGSMVLRRSFVAHALTCKGGFAEVQRDGFGQVTNIWLLTPDRVESHRKKLPNGDLGPLMWVVDGNEDKPIPDADMLHVTGLGYDGINGYGTIAMARQAIGLGLAAEKFGGQYFGRGTIFGGHLAVDDEMDEDQKKDLLAAIQQFRTAQDSAFRILITEGGKKFTQFANKPNESQMDELRTQQVLEVARFFRMPPVRLGVTIPGAVSYASAEVSNQDYYTGCLLDWITLIEEEFNQKLISPLEQNLQFIKHNANAFLRGDTKARSDFYSAMTDRGIFNADDVLELEDRNPQPNGQGKLYLVQGAQVPKDLLVKLVESKIDSEKAKSNPPQPPPAPAPAPNDPDAAGVRSRLQAAELEVTRLQAELHDQREASAALRATGTATEAQLQEMRTAEVNAVTVLAQMTAAVTSLRAELAAAQESRIESATEVGRLTAELAEARTEVDDAEARVAMAEQDVRSAVEARQAADAQATEAQAALERATTEAEASGRSAAESAALLASTREEVSRAQATASEHGQRVADLIAELAQEREQLLTARAERDRLVAELGEANTSADAARQDATEARATAELASKRAQTAEAERDAAQSTASAASVTAAGAEQREQETARAAARASAEASQALEEAQARLGELSRELDAAREQVEAARREANEASAATASATQREQETASTSAQALAEARQAVGDAEARLFEAVREVEAARQQAEAAAATAQAAQQTATDAEAARRAAESSALAIEQRERERRLRTVSANRSLFVDVVGRMARREAQQARSKQGTAQKLRRWLEYFGAEQEAAFVEAIAPAMRVHLAWMGSDLDPVAESVSVARSHVALFVTRMTAVLDGAGDADFHADLDRVLARWESERPEAVADAIMEQEIRDVA